MTLYQELTARGLLAQRNDDGVEAVLNGPPATFYVGYDMTADSLTAGHFLSLSFVRRLQQAGHRPLILLGGATTMIGDPTGKTDMRPMLSREQIAAYGERFKKQMSRMIDFGPGGAVMVNNADWLLGMNYIEFLRDVGVHFSVNRMLTAECYRSRLEGKGLSFIEFNYMLMQSYDFLHLFREYGCTLQIGGDDQWSNILNGADLIRRVLGRDAYVQTHVLLETSDGVKMGKTAKGALWLDPDKTAPYDFYQYWRNVGDEDVIRFLKILTFLPLDEIAHCEALAGSGLNTAKELLAFEITRLVHGDKAAEDSRETARSLFSGGDGPAHMPSSSFPASALADMGILDLLVRCGLTPSTSEARRLVLQGGIEVDGVRVSDPSARVCDVGPDGLVIKKGKKVYHRVTAV